MHRSFAQIAIAASNESPNDASAAALGLDGASVATAEDAQNLISNLEVSVEQVGEMRSEIGATTNTLQTTSNNLVRAN